MPVLSTGMYNNSLPELVTRYNNAIHRTIKTKSAIVKAKTYTNLTSNFNAKNFKFKLGVYIQIWKESIRV